MVKLLSGKDDATAYFAAIPLMTIVFSSGFPLALGRLMDAMAGDHGVDSYKIMFGLCFICTAATLVFACRTHFCSPVKTTP